MQINRCQKCGREPITIRFRAVENFNSIPKISTKIECYACAVNTGQCKSYDEAVAKWNELTKGEMK